MPDNSVFKGYRADQIGVGNEGNTSKVNQPGTYFDPESENETTVFHTAAADALVRMGWIMIKDRDGNKVENRFSLRPEDTPEVLKLREQLEAAQAQLKKQTVKKPAAPKQPKAPKAPKVLTTNKEGEN